MNNEFTPTLEVGTVLNDKWVILEFVGKGGMGEVYRAHQLNLKRDVAVKIISQEWLSSMDSSPEEITVCIERFSREVELMAQMRHPNVLQIFDHDSITVKKNDLEISIEFMVMEYLPGSTLRSTMSEEGFYPDEGRIKDWIATYFLPLIEGIRSLHENGIIHRDLKPENILLDGTIPKIADFGLARSCRLKSLTQSVDVRGTPPYMSPEHFMDLRRTDERADVYSLGKILYEAIEGKIGTDEIPFKKASLRNAQSPFFRRLDNILQDSTTEDRSQRIPSMEALREAIEALIRIDACKEVPLDVKPLKRFKLCRIPIIAVVLMLFVGIAVGVGLMYLYEGPETVLAPPHGALPRPMAGADSMEKERISPFVPGEALPKTIQGEDEDVMHLISGGDLAVPEGFGSQGGKSVKIPSFYLDENQVTNHQYVDFLNEKLSRIKVEGDIVKDSDGKIWMMLGEVIKGYEPIVYREGRFHIQRASHASSPVLRVTGYGARAYVEHYGRRLITDVEWLYAVTEGGRAANTYPGAVTEPTPVPAPEVTQAIPAPVLFFKPNVLGIRGLNESLGEWGQIDSISSRKGMGSEKEFVVMGGHLSGDAGRRNLPSVVSRKPWEALEAVGFRCALSAPVEAG